MKRDLGGPDTAKAPTLPSLIDEYLQRRQVEGVAWSTLNALKRPLAAFARFANDQGTAGLSEVDEDLLEAFTVYLKQTYRISRGPHRGGHLQAGSLQAWLSTVVGFVKFLVRSDHLLLDPLEAFDRPRHRKTRRAWVPSVAEVDRFLAVIGDPGPKSVRDRALFELLYSTGLRIGEACGLDLYDVDMASAEVRVRSGKGGRDRVVPLGRVAGAAVREYVSEARPLFAAPVSEEALFVNQHGRRLTPQVAQIWCRTWGRRARLSGLTPHLLRHAMATHMLAAGADVRHVREILGHAWITTTQQYTWVGIEDLMECHRKTHPREVRSSAGKLVFAVPQASGAQGIREADPGGVRRTARAVPGVPAGAGHRSS